MPALRIPSVASLKRALEIAEQIERLQAQLVGGNAAGETRRAALNAGKK